VDGRVKVKDMAVVKSKKYIGIIEEADLLDRNNIADKLESYTLNLKKPFVYKQQHIFEVIWFVCSTRCGRVTSFKRKRGVFGG
jgi:hypothetical protein